MTRIPCGGRKRRSLKTGDFVGLKVGHWERNTILTKSPFMVVAWRVHLEPCRGVAHATKPADWYKSTVMCCSASVWGSWPAGRREPRTWAVGCRGTAPSAPSSPGRSGVSTPTQRQPPSVTHCTLWDVFASLCSLTSYFSSAQSIQCSLLGDLEELLKRFLMANYGKQRGTYPWDIWPSELEVKVLNVWHHSLRCICRLWLWCCPEAPSSRTSRFRRWTRLQTHKHTHVTGHVWMWTSHITLSYIPYEDLWGMHDVIMNLLILQNTHFI